MALAQTDQAPLSKGGKTAQRVRDAALHLFAKHGYAAVSMRQIAEQVGVRPGALYNHFPTKQDILKDLMQSHMAALLDAWDQEAARASPGTDLLEAFVRFHIRYHMDRTDEIFISYMELRNLEPHNFSEVATDRRKYEAVLNRILEHGTDTGRYAVSDAKVATRAIIAMLTAIPSWFREDGSLSREDIERLYIDMVRKLVAQTPNQDHSGKA
ncbi:TetR/AcrR family transcriptional regulator [Roseibium sp. RKSG952]|uniref:TetR/AcrR family transcriptional regulator n=1 Tax=Roseibium sp. RKSG952 TaxID=2529384 RepID=UPI0012BCBBB2|nr:TetR/AcrR family transcriptional regulator [Roseibium sp. RKSG952]MTH99280.1 TetR/AcrR family transcriptional regulator [Roseibium sp. RKSG952]